MSSRREKSDSESSPESEDEGGNTFANDGSFLEMFKRRMEEQKRQEKAKSELGAAGHASTGMSSTAKMSTSATKPALSSATEVPKASVNKPYQVVQYFSMNHIKLSLRFNVTLLYVRELRHDTCQCPLSLLHTMPSFDLNLPFCLICPYLDLN